MEVKENLISIINPLASWLENLQIGRCIQQIEIMPDDTAFIKIEHPVLGLIERRIPVISRNPVRVEGIGLEKVPSSSGTISCYDFGAIFDPLDWFVPGDHYASSHFALLQASLIKLGLRKDTRPIKWAFEFQKHRGQDYAFSGVEPHWEFNNIAWIETQQLISEIGDTDLANEIRKYLLKAPKHVRPFATNWKAMLGSFLSRNGKESQKPLHRLLGQIYLFLVSKACERDGSIADIVEQSRSIQYHFYTAALLARYAYLTNDLKSKKAAIAAANYGINFIDPDGDCNFKGRGQRQIFGYAAAIYLFVVCAVFEPQRSDFWLDKASLVTSYISTWQREDGSFPLVLNYLDEHDRIGWHDYHHLTVYNAFTGAWLALAALHLQSFTSTNDVRLLSKVSEIKQDNTTLPIINNYELSGVLAVKAESYYICVSRGETYYDTDCGFAPHHIWIKGIGSVISCPGGPDQDHYGKLYRSSMSDWNYFSPIVSKKGKVIASPARKKHGGFKKISEGTYKQVAKYGGTTFVRTWSFDEAGFTLLDEIIDWQYDLDTIAINFPILTSKVELFQGKTKNDWEVKIYKGKSNSFSVHITTSIFFDLHIARPIPLTRGITTFVKSKPQKLTSPVWIKYSWLPEE